MGRNMMVKCHFDSERILKVTVSYIGLRCKTISVSETVYVNGMVMTIH